MNTLTENSSFAQSNLFKDVSALLKKNVLSLGKNIRRKATAIEEEPKKLLSSVSKQVLYILNSHHPLQSKIQDIFKKYTNKSKKEPENQENQENQREPPENKENQITEESKDHGIGSNMTEQGMNTNNNFVPILLNHSSSNTRYCESEHNPGRFDKSSIVNVKCQT